MASFIELIAKIKQKNNGTFKLVDAQDVECEDGKGLDEVLNEKLDKNQGVENAGKTMVVGADGNLVVGDSSPKNVYTKEEVDYLLDDKMDKPYVPIEITDNATITDALEGNFKIDKIKGNTYQNVEENIVPMPSRPVPINSRKTLVTKANPNMFNFEKESDTSKIPDSGTYRSIGQHQLKANTKYVFSWSGATVPAKATLSFQIQDDKGTVLVSPFTYFNLESTEKKETGKKVEFTTNESGIVKFAYNCTDATSNTTEMYQQYWYTKILKDISLKEDVEYEPEYVELRSLKETVNLFDLGLLSQVNLIPDNKKSYRKINIPITLKPNTRYKIYYENSLLPALSWMVLNIVDNTEKIIVSILNVRNTENNEIEKPAINLAFTSPDDGEIYFSYYVQMYNIEGDLIPQTTETFKEKWFTKILKNIMITEKSLNQNTYVPSTVRDYKIVDHTTQTSKIVRNVVSKQLEQNDITGMDLNYAIMNGFGFIGQEKIAASYSDKMSYVVKGQENQLSNLFTYSDAGLLELYIKDYTTLEEYRNWVEQNKPIMQTAAKTPTEETIAYSADDVSEVGYSWQDTTSPSPDIPSQIEGVNEIDITVTGKNLFDINDEDVYLSPNITHNGNQIIKNEGSIFPRIKLKNLVIDKEYTLSYSTKLNKSISNAQLLSAISSKNMGYPDGVILYKVGDGGTDYNVEIKFTATQSEMYLIFSIQPETITNLQIELGDTATSYEPYQEQHINITSPQPLYSTVDGSIADEVDVEKGVYRYWLLKDKIENLATAVNIAQKHGNFQSYFITKVKDNSLKPITLLGNEDTRNLICNKCNVNLLDYNNEKETFSLYVDKSAVFVGNINIERLNENTTLNIYNFIKDFEIVYPLLTPIEIPIPQEDLKLLKSLKTEQGVMNIFVGGEVKPTIETRYPRDLALVQQQLEQKILLISDLLIDTQAKVLLQGGN